MEKNNVKVDYCDLLDLGFKTHRKITAKIVRIKLVFLKRL